MNSTQRQPKNDTVGKIIHLMEALVRSERVTSVRDLAAAAGVPRSTAHRFLAALESYGWAVQDAESGAYRAGLRFFLLNHRPCSSTRWCAAPKSRCGVLWGARGKRRS